MAKPPFLSWQSIINIRGGNIFHTFLRKWKTNRTCMCIVYTTQMGEPMFMPFLLFTFFSITETQFCIFVLKLLNKTEKHQTLRKIMKRVSRMFLEFFTNNTYCLWEIYNKKLTKTKMTVIWSVLIKFGFCKMFRNLSA